MATPFEKYRCRACTAEFFAQMPGNDPDKGATPICPKCGSSDTQRVFAAGNPLRSPYDRGAGGGCCGGPYE